MFLLKDDKVWVIIDNMSRNKNYGIYVIHVLVVISICISTVLTYTQSAPSIGHVCGDGCHVCLKSEYNENVKIPLTNTGKCNGTGNDAQNGDLVCIYGYPGMPKTYLINEHVTTADGCNTCVCTARGAHCTQQTCKGMTFATPSNKPLYGECNDNDRWYKFGALWKADDGCNTCTCVGIGNYQGPFICSQGICDNVAGPVG